MALEAYSDLRHITTEGDILRVQLPLDLVGLPRFERGTSGLRPPMLPVTPQPDGGESRPRTHTT